MMYEPGSQVYDLNGAEWIVTKVWDYKNYLCMMLVGTSGETRGQLGGHRVEYEDGGALMVTRK